MEVPPTAPVKAYICECGKKWTFRAKTGSKFKPSACDCGRVIVVRHGMMFSTGKPTVRKD